MRRGDAVAVEPRLRFDLNRDETAESGYLFQAEDPLRDWPADAEAAIERYPPDWIDRAGDRSRVRRNRRDDCPEWITVDSSGNVAATGRRFLFLKAPFSFCPHCDTAYPKRERNDMSKLRTLGVDSRSTATTILALNAVQHLRLDSELDQEAKKLLSFTDNRQDASLQAGHFNDFVEVALVRSGLVRALQRAGDSGLRFSTLSQAVFDALSLPFDQYSAQPEARFAKRHEIDRVFRKALGCRLYRDLLRGWRISSPNLEQCGLLRFEYESLKDVCADEAIWLNCHRLLREARPESRIKICSTLLDSLRRSLAIEAEELSPQWLEQTSREANDYLLDEWALGDTTRAQQLAPIVWPRSLTDQDQGEDIPVSAASKFGQFLRRPTTFGQAVTLSMQETDSIIADLFRVLEHDFLRPVHAPRTPNGPKGYRLGGESLIWRLGDGSPAVDPLRQERVSSEGSKANQFFHKFYCEFAGLGGFLTAREHTAQVGAEERKAREERFKSAQLPILFCSPTMELGVDIAQLNVVNMRNMPPTPANYAQRSGRAGRGGQPALVYTYCSGFSPHDQYFFSRPDQMVAGSVQPPRIELANEALLRAHIHAIWLGETGADLGKTLADVLVVSEEKLDLPIRPDIFEQMTSRDAETSAIQKADRLLSRVRDDLSNAAWFDDTWLERTIKGAARSLDAACERWRELYIAAVKQRRLQNQIIGDHGRSEADRKLARSLRQQAEAQIELLTNSAGRAEGDFYSYRYFASEGFLPGYSFPRLPVSAFVPGRRGTVGEHEYLNRPRFLAISEFGPNAIIYHEGARFRIHRANVALDVDGSGPSMSMMKSCGECGYAHMGAGLADLQVCARCATPLEQQHEFSRLVRMQNVSARRLERITSDEEERQRQGYDVRSYFAFPMIGGILARRTGRAEHQSGTVAHLEYGDTCSLWRLNLGWARRQHGTDHGFFLDLEKGEWVSRDDAEVQDGVAAARPNAQRVIPFVSDTKNALLFTPKMIGAAEGFMPSLEAALKRGIQHVFQVESSEIAVDCLPSRQRRNHLLFYEASEGGAGVLRQLLEPGNLSRVATAALELCHFDLTTNEDCGHSHRDGCEAACYDCLLDFGNQGDHRLIDRKLVQDFLRMLTASTVVPGEAPPPAGDPWHRLYSVCDSQLERRFLDVLRQHGFRQPDHGQFWIPERYSRPDFYYAQGSVCVFIDGPPHDEPQQAEDDLAVRARLVADGYQVLVFHHARTDWMSVLRSHPAVFGPVVPRGQQ